MYSARITRLENVRKHPNADRLQLASCVGNQVVVGLSNAEGDLGVYFPTDGQLSHEMCVANNLYNKSAAQQLGLPEPSSFGFFDTNRRVRAQKFRGEKSDGMWLPLDCLSFWDQAIWDPQEGTLISDPAICQRYETEATKRAKANGNKAGKPKRGETVMFKKHMDTEQFRYGWQDIPAGSLITLTEKLHGTSGRYAHVKEPTGKRWWEFWKDSTYWTHLMGSRNVVIEHSNGSGYYGSDEFRYAAVEGLTLRKGETIYFELVGDYTSGWGIMPQAQVDKKELPEVYKQYGDKFHWRYGTKDGECALYVYRITQSNEDGQAVELSWAQVKQRCKELGINHVPEVVAYFDPVEGGGISSWFWQATDGAADHYKHVIETEANGPSLLDNSHIREGVCIRVDTPTGRTYWLKEKSYEFKVLEGIIKLRDDVVDIEESA